MSLKKYFISTLLVSVIMPLSALAAGSDISSSAVKAPVVHTTTAGLCRWQTKNGKSWNPCYGYANSTGSASNGTVSAAVGSASTSQTTTGGLCSWKCINGVYQDSCNSKYKNTSVSCKGVPNGGVPAVSVKGSALK